MYDGETRRRLMSRAWICMYGVGFVCTMCIVWYDNVGSTCIVGFVSFVGF